MTDKPIEEEAQDFVSEDKGVESVADAINGAKDIIAEHISDEADYRIYLRKLTMDRGSVASTAKKPEESSVMKCIMNLKSRSKSLRDIVCLP